LKRKGGKVETRREGEGWAKKRTWRLGKLKHGKFPPKISWQKENDQLVAKHSPTGLFKEGQVLGGRRKKGIC